MGGFLDFLGALVLQVAQTLFAGLSLGHMHRQHGALQVIKVDTGKGSEFVHYDGENNNRTFSLVLNGIEKIKWS